MLVQEKLIYPLLILTVLVNPSLSQNVPSMVFSQEAAQLVQNSMACFTVTTTQKIMKTKDHEEDKNIFFSPLDLYQATALAFLGADGQSRKKLGNILGIKEPRRNVHTRRRRQQPKSLEDIHQTVSAVINQTRNLPSAVVQYGSGVFVYNDFFIKSTYIEDARNFYGIDVKCTDFKNQNQPSTDLINKYIAQRTYKRISKFFPTSVSPDTTLVIPSTLSTVSKWRNLFNPSDTYESAFHTREDGCEDSNVCMMTNLQTIPYFHDKESHIEAIAIPFTDPDLYIYFVLPQKTSQLNQIVTYPNKNDLLKIIESMQLQKIKYHIPKMLLQARINEMELLKQTGIKNLTENEIADNLPLTHLEQVVEIELNEEGIGGCAVDTAKSSPSVENVTDPNALDFIVDRPYIFFVHHKSAKTFLYYGVIYKPVGYSK